jgi:hypothetical protein
MLKFGIILSLVLLLLIPLSASSFVDKDPPSISRSPGIKVGSTWCDFQHTGSISKQIVLDPSPSGCVHFFWLNCLDSGGSNRYAYYNASIFFPDSFGFQIDPPVSTRSGRPTGDILSGGRAVASYHNKMPQWTGPFDFASAVAIDLVPCIGAFSQEFVDTITLPPEVATTAIWPHTAVDLNDNIHVVARQIPLIPGDPASMWYSLSNDLGQTFSPWVLADDSLLHESYDVQTSRNSGRVAISYAKAVPWDFNSLNQDIHYVESTDFGVTWNFGNSINVTNFTPSDSLRAFPNLSTLYDNNDSLHLAFTLRKVEGDSLFSCASLIVHWSKETGITIINSDPLIGWHCQSDTISSIIMAGSPSLGINPSTGDLFCVFVGRPPGDTSAAGFPNGELFAARSSNMGLTWGSAVNLTNTPSPGCVLGECDDDGSPSLAEIVNDTLHIMYMNDKNAGGSLPRTLNPVLYLKVPVDSITVGQEEEESSEFGLRIAEFGLKQNTPNPFNKLTAVSYELGATSHTTLQIYDLTGRLVETLVDENQEPGVYQVEWDGSNQASGVYFYKLRSSDFQSVKKVILLK